MGLADTSRSTVTMPRAWGNQVLPGRDDASVPRTAKERGRSTTVSDSEAFFASKKPETRRSNRLAVIGQFTDAGDSTEYMPRDCKGGGLKLFSSCFTRPKFVNVARDCL